MAPAALPDTGPPRIGQGVRVDGEENRAVVERWFASLRTLAIDDARACWHPDAVWRVQDHNEFGGDYRIDDYLSMLGEFLAKYGVGYEFEIDETRAHGDLVVVFLRSTQPQLGTTEGLMIYRLRDGLIVEGWGIGRGSDSQNPW